MRFFHNGRKGAPKTIAIVETRKVHLEIVANKINSMFIHVQNAVGQVGQRGKTFSWSVNMLALHISPCTSLLAMLHCELMLERCKGRTMTLPAVRL